MKRFFKWGCLSIVRLFIISAVVSGLTGCGDKTAKAPTAPALAQSAPAAATPQPAATKSSPVPAVTATPKPPTPTPAPKLGTRQAPVPLGEPYLFSKSGRQYGVGVLKVERKAWPLVKQANMFNTEPPTGNDYILVQMALVYEKGPEDKPMKTSDGGYKFYADNRFWGAPGMSNVPPEPRFSNQDIFPGAKVSGWLGGRYLPLELIEDAVLVYDDVYFALK